jgi:hypothetical protein
MKQCFRIVSVIQIKFKYLLKCAFTSIGIINVDTNIINKI